MTDRKTQAQVAEDLAQFLTTPQSIYGQPAKSPLKEVIEAQILQMTRELAAEVIKATPELHEHVKQMVTQTIRQSLNDDPWLSQTVISAVSKALTDVALERRAARDD